MKIIRSATQRILHSKVSLCSIGRIVNEAIVIRSRAAVRNCIVWNIKTQICADIKEGLMLGHTFVSKQKKKTSSAVRNLEISWSISLLICL